MESVSSYRQKIQFVIGFAGSGKSTKLAASCKDKPEVLVLTPTHKAAMVLKNKGITNVYTIHSALKLIPTINENARKGQKLQRLKKIGETDMSTIKMVALDEFSMVPTNIMDLLLEVLPEDAKVMVFGDASQLPPVDGEPIDPEQYTDNILRLTTQHRAKAPHVVETFMRFHHYIENPTGQANLVVSPNYPDLCKGTLKDFNPATDRILAYTNQRVIELNAQASIMLGKEKAICYGEDILINQLSGKLSWSDGGMMLWPGMIAKGRLMDDTERDKARIKIEDTLAKWDTDIPYRQTSVDVDGEQYTIYYDYEHYATSKKLKAAVYEAQDQLVRIHKLSKEVHIPTWCKENRGATGIRERGAAWSAYLTHQNHVFDVRRPYASTCHKAQGQEFSTVFIDQEDMKKAVRNGYYEGYARLMYVALSRAINKVVIL